MPRYRTIRGTATRILPAILLAGLHALPAAAQWVQTGGPKGGSIRSLAAVPASAGGTNLFAASTYVWRSGDQGASWSQLANGLTDPNTFGLVAVPNGSGGNDLVVGTSAGIFRSTDEGASWSPSNNGITNLEIRSLGSGPDGSGGTFLYAGAFLGDVFRSNDRGATWTTVSAGLPVGQATAGPFLAASTGTVLAATGNGIYRSVDFGNSWTRVFANQYAFSFAKNGTTLYAGTSNGVYRSTNDGVSWTAINNGMNFTWVYSLAAIPNGSGVTLFAGAGGVLRSTDNGATWTMANSGITATGIYALVTAPNPAGGTDLYAGTPEGIFRTTNSGASWTNVSFVSSSVQALEVTPSGAILAGAQNDIFRSTDGGSTWVDDQIGASMTDFLYDPANGGSLFACGASVGIFQSTDDGVTWVDSNHDIADIEVNSLAAVPNGSGGTNLLAGDYSGIFLSTDHGGSWVDVDPRYMPLDWVVTPNGSGGSFIFGGGFGGVVRSADGGFTWTSTGLSGIPRAMATTHDGATVFAGGEPFGIYRSTDNGGSWQLVNGGLTDLRITSLLSPDGVHLFAGGAGGVFLSSDDGNSWTSVGTGLRSGVLALATSADGATLLAGSATDGVWKRPLSEMIGGSPPPPPPPAPAIASFTPASGAAGSAVTVTGSNFTGASAVTFNLATASYTVLSSTQIQTIVPAGASTGRIRVTTPGGTATSAGDFTVTAAPPPTTLIFVPPHDASVASNKATSNYGSQSVLSVKEGGAKLRSYLKFNVTGVVGTVQSVKLRLRVADAGPDGGSVSVVSNNYAGSSTAWTESGLTWNNAPAPGTALRAIGAVSANTLVEVDVTSAVGGNGIFSFAVSGGTSNQVDYGSAESANSPQLVVVAAGSSGMTTQAPADDENALGIGGVVAFANQPNPFEGGTTIRYALPRATTVRLVVYDVTGRAVRILVNGPETAGERHVWWDGRDGGGARVRAGLYLCKLEAGTTTLTRKLTVTR